MISMANQNVKRLIILASKYIKTLMIKLLLTHVFHVEIALPKLFLVFFFDFRLLSETR